MSSFSNRRTELQYSFILVELMIVVTITGTLTAIAIASYQIQVRKTDLTTIYQELNHFRLTYQILVNKGADASELSPSDLDILEQTEYC